MCGHLEKLLHVGGVGEQSLSAAESINLSV